MAFEPVNMGYNQLLLNRRAEWESWEKKISEEVHEISETLSDRVVQEISEYFTKCLDNPTLHIPTSEQTAEIFPISFSFTDVIEKSFFWNCLNEDSVFFEIRNRLIKQYPLVKHIIINVDELEKGKEVADEADKDRGVNKVVHCKPPYKTDFAQINKLFTRVIETSAACVKAKLEARDFQDAMPLKFDCCVKINEKSSDMSFASFKLNSGYSKSASRNYSLDVKCWLPIKAEEEKPMIEKEKPIMEKEKPIMEKEKSRPKSFFSSWTS